jgi:putative salt-induced outer membrane protein
MRLFALSAVLAALPTLAGAAPWSGEVAAGFLATSGNSETRSLNGKLALDYTAESWKNGFMATALGSSDSDGTTAERYTLADKLDYNFSERQYVFGALEWEKDLFGGIRERTSETVGYGYRVLTGPVHSLDLELGAGARQTKENGTGIREDDLIGRAAGKYVWTISETSHFSQTLKVESGESNTFTESVSELKLNIIGNVAAALSYTVRNNSEVPADTDKTDSFTAVNLVYGFGKS